MNITKNQIQTILDTLKDLPESSQKAFRDALVITSENDWHDLVHSSLDAYVDTENDSYTWYREDELTDCGYIHESDLKDAIESDLELVDKVLAKKSEYRVNIDIIYKLKNNETLTKDESELVNAMLEDEGML